MIDLDKIELLSGGHTSRYDVSGQPTVCAMELVAWLGDEEHSDAPKCVSPEIAAYVRVLNDAMPDDQRQRLKPYLPRTMNTEGDGRMQERVFALADASVRAFAANALESAGLTEQANTLRALAPIIDAESAAWSARSAARSAGSAAESARSAAESARSAAWSARSAAWSARSAARSARSAAESAWSAAESAAWSAAESAAESARSAAESARSAAESAWDAALEVLDKILP